MTDAHHHDHEGQHRSGIQGWLLSRTGIATCVAVTVLAFLVYTGHSAHLLGALPYLLILSCPLMHIFMHSGHHHHDNSDRKNNNKEGD